MQIFELLKGAGTYGFNGVPLIVNDFLMIEEDPSSAGVQSVTGTSVDNTDPLNPVVNLSGITPKFISSHNAYHLTMVNTWQPTFNMAEGTALFTPSEMLEGNYYEVEIAVYDVGSAGSGIENKYYALTFTSDVANVSSRISATSDVNYQSLEILCKLKYLISFEGATASTRTVRFKLIDCNGKRDDPSFGMVGLSHMYNFTINASVNQTLELYFQWNWTGGVYGGGTVGTIVSHAKCQKIL